MRVENPILWLNSKRALSDNPFSWLSSKRHYQQFEERIRGLGDEELKKERAKYNHNRRNDLIITSLALAAEGSVVALVGPHVDSFALLLSAGPAAAGACLVGITRGIIRDSEKGILQEEIDNRSLEVSGTVYSASKGI